jgi:pSer/pThr/pTyr-binding forkhead associated (FHA) protein
MTVQLEHGSGRRFSVVWVAVALFATLCCTGVLAGTKPTPTAQITSNPQFFVNTTTVVRGAPTDTQVSPTGVGWSYQLDDPTGSITVTTLGAAPPAVGRMWYVEGVVTIDPTTSLVYLAETRRWQANWFAENWWIVALGGFFLIVIIVCIILLLIPAGHGTAEPQPVGVPMPQPPERHTRAFGQPVGQLEVLRGPETGAVFPLFAASANVIGSDQSCTVLGGTADQGISSQHAEIRASVDGTFALTDLRSTNGTFVNGRVIQQANLREGDIIEVGSTQLRVRITGRFQGSAPRPGDQPTVAVGPQPSAAETVIYLGADLEVVEGAGVGQRHPITNTRFTIGRREDRNLVLTDQTVSRCHAIIEATENGFELVNESSNGTQLNGSTVSRSPLSDGDRIRLGAIVLQFHRASNE